MFSIKRNRETAMIGVVAPVVHAVSLPADVLADVAARYGAVVAPEARAIRVKPGGQADAYAVNAQGRQVWVRAALSVDGVLQGEAVPVGYHEAQRRAASCQVRRRGVGSGAQARVVALVDQGLSDSEIADQLGLRLATVMQHRQRAGRAAGVDGAARRAETLQARNAARLVRVRELLSRGFSRADVLADLAITDSALRDLTAGQGITWPYVKWSTAAKVAKVAGPARVAVPAPVVGRQRQPSALIVRLGAQHAARLRVLREMMGQHETVANIQHALGLKDVAYVRRMIRAEDAQYPLDRQREAANRASRFGARVLALASDGLDAAGIVAATGFTLVAVRRHLRAAGRDPGHANTRRREARNARLRELVNQGLTGPQIAKEMGMTLSAVHSACTRALLVLKTPKGGDMQPGRDRSRITARQAVVARMVRAGARDAEIVAATGASHATISHDKKVLGLSGQSAYQKARPSFGRSHPELWGPVMARLAQGEAARDIARALGLQWWDVRSVIRVAEAAGVTGVALQVAA